MGCDACPCKVTVIGITTMMKGVLMRFDPNTCRMVEDEWRHRSPHYDTSPRVEEEHWIWKVLSIVIFIVWAAIGFNWLDDHYSWGVISKIKSSFTSMTDEGVSSEKSSNEDHTSRIESNQSATWTIICCVCNARLDASHLQHLRSFDCICPNCGSNLHVENNN